MFSAFYEFVHILLKLVFCNYFPSKFVETFDYLRITGYFSNKIISKETSQISQTFKQSNGKYFLWILIQYSALSTERSEKLPLSPSKTNENIDELNHFFIYLNKFAIRAKNVAVSCPLRYRLYLTRILLPVNSNTFLPLGRPWRRWRGQTPGGQVRWAF